MNSRFLVIKSSTGMTEVYNIDNIDGWSDDGESVVLFLASTENGGVYPTLKGDEYEQFKQWARQIGCY